jgi:hypothetical protein
MNFLYPTAFWFLIAILIPIIIHLFSFRRYKTIYFSQTRFLESVKNDNRSKTKLKQILILLSRILMIISLVFAFANPIVLPEGFEEQKNSASYLAVYVDNSFSMQNETEQGQMLDVAKQYAIEIAESYGESYQFFLLTNSLRAEDFRAMQLDMFIEQCGNIKLSPVTLKLSDVNARMQEVLLPFVAEDELAEVYFVSDFQKYVTDISHLSKSFRYRFVKINSVLQQNLSIDSVWFDVPYRSSNQTEQLFVKLTNHGSNAYTDIPVKLIVNDSLRAIGSGNLSPKNSEIIELKFTGALQGNQKAVLEIDDYPVSFDNRFYFNYDIDTLTNVLIVQGDKMVEFPSDLYDLSEFNVDYIQFDDINISELKDYQLLIIHAVEEFTSGFQSQLMDWLKNSNALWLIPGENADMASWNQLLKQMNAPLLSEWKKEASSLYEIAYEHDFYRSVFPRTNQNVSLPSISGSWKFLKNTATNSEALISFRDKTGFLELTQFENSYVYLMASPPHENYSDFYRHPLFIPVSYNIGLNIPTQKSLYFICGNHGSLDIERKEKVQENIVKIKSTEEEIIPMWKYLENAIRVFIPDDISYPGHYEILLDDQLAGILSMNLTHEESNLECINTQDLEGLISEHGLEYRLFSNSESLDMNLEIEKSLKGEPVWHLFLLLALLFIIIEIVLIKLLPV